MNWIVGKSRVMKLHNEFYLYPHLQRYDDAVKEHYDTTHLASLYHIPV